MKSTIPTILALAIASTSTTMAEIQKPDVEKPPPADALHPSKSLSKNTNNKQPALINKTSSRGKLLYENHCVGCHDSTTHIRAHHKVKTFNDINHWVTRWSRDLSLKWKADEIDDVVNYLNQEFYKFKAPVRD